MVFFKEWKDDKQLAGIASVIILIVLFLVLGVYINIPSIAQTASIYLFLLLISLFIFVLDSSNDNNGIVGAVSIGRTWKNAILAFVIGGGIMVFLVGIKSLTLISVPLTAIADQNWNFLFVVIVAPLVEEVFFRMCALYTAIQFFKNAAVPYHDVSAAIFVNICFGLFHGYAYGWNAPAMVAAFIFGMVVTIGNQLFQSSSFGWGAHVVNNMLIWYGG